MDQSDTIAQFNAFRKEFKNKLSNLESTLSEFQKKEEPYQQAKVLSSYVEDDAFLNFEITQKVIQEMEKKLGFKLNKTETSTLKYMLAADDFSLMKTLKQGYEAIRPYAIPLLKQVAKSYGIPADIIDLLPDKDTRSAKVLVKKGRDLSAANRLAICTLICPEVYRARFPTLGAVNGRVALGHGRMTIPVTTNNVGAGVINCYLRAPGAINFVISLHENTLSLIAGNQAIAGVTYIGPYQASAIVDQGFSLATTVSFRPTLSAMNANGRVYLSYYQEEVIATARNISFVPQGDALQAPFFQEGTILSELRQVSVMNSPEDLSMNETLAIGSGHVAQLIVQGGPVSQVVGQFVVDYTIQFTCFANYMNLIDLDTPAPGPATVQTVNTLFSEHPKLSQLPFQQAQKVCECILATSGSYEDIVDCVLTQ